LGSADRRTPVGSLPERRDPLPGVAAAATTLEAFGKIV